MQTALLTNVNRSTDPQVLTSLPTEVARTAVRPQPRHSDLDSLLKTEVKASNAAALDFEMEPEPGPGLFFALRAALFFNAGLGLTGLLAYEAWQMFAR